MHLSSFRTPAALLAAVVALSLSFAAPLAARADGDDTSGVGVARISLVHGSVAVQRGDSTGPIDAVINAPVLGGDYVTTGEGARAELQLDGTSAVRLGSGVQLRLTHLDAGNRELQLAEGTVDLRLLHGADLHAGIDTPSISIRPREAGSYRVSVDGSGQTAVTVRSGAADVVTPQGDQQLGPGTTLFASGTASNPVITSGAALAYDDFDRFNQDRDQPELRAQSAENRYVDTTIDGVDDLGAYGRWVADGSYGQVWVPYDVAAGWAPYRDGRWVWEDYYGWTWVAAEPWGWAPYHYGSWYHSPAYGWAWYPPRPAYYAPVWQPALVAFISFGSGSWGGLGFGIGSGIGWVPLAPFEPYHPWWGRGYNVTNVTNVDEQLLRQRQQRQRHARLPQHARRGRDGDRRAALRPGPVRPPGRGRAGAARAGCDRPRRGAGRADRGQPALHLARHRRAAARGPAGAAPEDVRRQPGAGPPHAVRRAAERDRARHPPPAHAGGRGGPLDRAGHEEAVGGDLGRPLGALRPGPRRGADRPRR